MQDEEIVGGELCLLPCCKEIVNPEELFAHIKDHHDKDATKCALCGKELSSKSSLDRHLLIHAKWQPYKCCHCNKQFSTNGNMHRHKKTHKGVFKGFKFVREEKPEHETAVQVNTTKFKNQNNSGCIRKEGFGNVIALKRKRKTDSEELCNQLAKKTKEICCEGTEQNSNEFQLEVVNPKDARQQEQEVITQRKEFPDGLAETLYSIDWSPEKAEFIATLGLNRPKERKCWVGLATEEHSEKAKWLERYLGGEKEKQPCRDKKIYSQEDCKKKNIKDDMTYRKLLIDCDKNNNDFADITSILSNVTAQPPVKVSELPLQTENDTICKSKLSNNSYSNLTCNWLPESPETSIECNVSVPASDKPMNKCSKKEEMCQRTRHCQSCNKEFKNELILEKHRLKCQKGKLFKCTQCGAKLQNKPNAVRHVVRVHKKRRSQAKTLIVYNFDDSASRAKTVCEWCGQDFTSNLILEHHKRASSGCKSKPFICLICNKSFSTKNNGKRHQTKHHRGEKDESCIIKNIIAKSSGDVSHKLTRLSGVESLLLVGDDQTVEMSVKCLEDEDADQRLRNSLPNKELDAAQSLIDMFSSVPTSIPKDPYEQPCSPVRQTTETHFRESPLDLSVQAVDLSIKVEDAFEVVPQSESCPNIPSAFVTPRKEKETCVASPHTLQNDFSSSVPLNLVKRERNSEDFEHLKTTEACGIFLPFHPAEIKNVPHWSAKPECKNKDSPPAETAAIKPSLVQCDFCSVSFANNSNKRRHEKKKHQLQRQGTPKGKCSSRMKTRSRAVVFTMKSILSKRTKEALLTKVSSSRPSDAANHERPSMVESGDLASVSSLISTANSPQLKQYLTTDTHCEVTTASTREDGKVKRTPEKHWCSICRKEFTCKSSFNRHSVIHTKEKSYHCPECKKAFTVKSNRDRHLKNLHRVFRRAQNKPRGSEQTATAFDDPLFARELTNSEQLQCNKENQRLCAHS